MSNGRQLEAQSNFPAPHAVAGGGGARAAGRRGPGDGRERHGVDGNAGALLPQGGQVAVVHQAEDFQVTQRREGLPEVAAKKTRTQVDWNETARNESGAGPAGASGRSPPEGGHVNVVAAAQGQMVQTRQFGERGEAVGHQLGAVAATRRQ